MNFDFSEGHPQVIEAILKKDPFCINDRDEDDNTPLHIGKELALIYDTSLRNCREFNVI